jgi:hypothetical protein
MTHAEAGHTAYLFGRFSTTGWWYYFPVALAVKTPIALSMAALAGASLILTRTLRNVYLPIAFSLGVLLPSMAGHVNMAFVTFCRSTWGLPFSRPSRWSSVCGGVADSLKL